MFCDDSRGVDYLHPREGRIVVDLNVLLRQSPYHPVLGKPLLAFTIKLITVLSEHREILQLQQLQDPVKRPFLIIFKQTPYEFAVIDLINLYKAKIGKNMRTRDVPAASEIPKSAWR